MFYVIHSIGQTGNHNTIIIDAEDADVIVLSSLVSHIESEVLGIRRKKSSFYCNKLCSPEFASELAMVAIIDQTIDFHAVFLM